MHAHANSSFPRIFYDNHVRASSTGERKERDNEMRYTGVETWDELGGGLNNLLMNLAAAPFPALR